MFGLLLNLLLSLLPSFLLAPYLSLWNKFLAVIRWTGLHASDNKYQGDSKSMTARFVVEGDISAKEIEGRTGRGGMVKAGQGEDDGLINNRIGKAGRVACFMIRGEWRQVPRKCWAWKPLAHRTTYLRCTEQKCHAPFNCWHDKETLGDHTYTDWIPELLCPPGFLSTRDLFESPTLQLLASHSGGQRDVATLGAQIPPELFPLILGSVDGELARTCRLVCRYWEEQCRGSAFAMMNLRNSEAKALDLVRFKNDPTWRHIPAAVVEIRKHPNYSNRSKVPWLHLLDPRWRRALSIYGPFPGQRTIRTIHFALPRSLPRSFSRGITSLILGSVNVRHFEDTACLISELPDLLDLHLRYVTWESLPTEYPRRRPRICRTKLQHADFQNCNIGGLKSSSFFFSAFPLFFSLSPTSSFFSSDVSATVEALLQVMSRETGSYGIDHRLMEEPDGCLDQIEFSVYRVPIITIRSPAPSSAGTHSISVFFHLGHDNVGVVNDDSDKWAGLNTAINSLQQPAQFTFGFDNHKCMLLFAAAVVKEKLASLSMRGEVRYTIAQEEKRLGHYVERKYWYQASPESEALLGKGTQDPWKVYP